MNKLFSVKRFKTILMAMTLAIFLALSSPSLKADGGFAISGSFQNYEYQIVQGETVETPGVNVVLFNNYDVDIDVELATNGPEGVEFILDSEVITIPANESVTIPVGVQVDEATPTGDYELGFSATVIEDEIEGIAVQGGGELRTDLSVMGEAADLKVSLVDYAENSLEADLRLYRVDNGSLDPVDEATTDALENRLVPGDYRLIARLEDYEVVNEDFSLSDGDDIDITLTAQTVFLDSFSVTPRFSRETDEFTNIRIDYEIVNIHEELEDVEIELEVDHEDEQIDDGVQLNLPVLPAGTYESSFTYTPPEGWESGEYVFRMRANAGDYDEDSFDESPVLAESRMRELDVPSDAVEEPLIEWDIFTVLTFIFGVILLGLVGYLVAPLIVAKRDKDRDKKDNKKQNQGHRDQDKKDKKK